MVKNAFYGKLCERACFDEKTVQAALNFADTCDMQSLSNLLFDYAKPKILKNGTAFYKNGFYPAKFFEYARTQTSKASICAETGFLYIYIALAEKSFDFFTSLGYEENVFFDTFEGISRACSWYRHSTGCDGVYDYFWLSGHLCANVIRLGAFEYQNGIFGFDKAPAAFNNDLKKGSGAVFLHVPFDTDFSLSSRLSSYKKAFDVFGEVFLVCDSWLLYPANSESLKSSSNISSFASDFDIFHVDHDLCYEDLYRIFGVNADFSDISKLPCETSLQRLYLERIKSGQPSGSAVGVRHLCPKM